MQSSAPATTGAEYPSDEGIERRRHPRYRMDGADEEPVKVSPQVDRRQRERRTVDDMRVELQRAYMQPGNAGNPPRSRWFGHTGLKPARLALVLVALIAGGLAAYLTSRPRAIAEPRVEAVTEVIKEPRLRVLVAKTAIGIGQSLLPDSIGWEDWPEGSVLSDYITAEAAPEAVETMSDAVARFEFFPGDPIRQQKLVRDAQGYLSAVLAPGMRGVSVAVSAVAASGGFISPNDHVDVVLTRLAPGIEASETILRNVRVLAINSRLGETGTTGAADPENPEAQPTARFNEAIATLELDETQTQVILGAVARGSLTLVVRAMSDFDEAEPLAEGSINQAIRLTSPFWTTPGSAEPR
jgi:pilus assembly protein CpaB